jgi:hypothetical protein
MLVFDSTFFINFWPNFWSTIVGGIVLTLFFFILKEHLFSLPALNGVWECEMVVEHTAYNPYQGLKVCYRVVLLQNGSSLSGAGEKDRETNADGEHRHTGKGRVPIEVTGVVQKVITGADVIRVQWKESGSRLSSTSHELGVSGRKTGGRLTGRYYTTAGECRGFATWTKIS